MTTLRDAADPTTKLKITVVSDFICPWCYIGLEVIDRLWQKYDFTLDWAPYFLDPSIPPEGRTRVPTTTAETPKSDLEKRAESEGIEPVEGARSHRTPTWRCRRPSGRVSAATRGRCWSTTAASSRRTSRTTRT